MQTPAWMVLDCLQVLRPLLLHATRLSRVYAGIQQFTESHTPCLQGKHAAPLAAT
jgi:hypothetical protein